MSVIFNDNIKNNSPKDINDKSGVFSGGVWRPYNTTEEALTRLDVAVRHKGLTITVLKDGENAEYWFKNGVTDADLVEKSGSGSAIEAYNDEKVYKLDNVVYIADSDGIELLYRSTADNNKGTFGGGGTVSNAEMNPAPIINMVNGFMLPFPMMNLVYDENLVLRQTSYDWNPDTGEQTPYDAIVVKLKKNDGRKVGLYANMGGGVSALAITATAVSFPIGSLKTIIFKTSENDAENTELVLDKHMLNNSPESQEVSIFYLTNTGVKIKHTVNWNEDLTIVDLTGVTPSSWQYLGYPKEEPIDTSKFLDNTINPQEKAGDLSIKGVFSSKNKRALFSGDYSFGNGYGSTASRNEYVKTINLNVGEKGGWTLLGDHYGISYFTSLFELTISDLDGSLSKTYRVRTSPSTSVYGLNGTNLDSGYWHKILPHEDVTGGLGIHIGCEVELEIQYAYPGRYRMRFRTYKPRTDGYTNMQLNCVLICDNSTAQLEGLYDWNGSGTTPVALTGVDANFSNNPIHYGSTLTTIGALLMKGKQTLMSTRTRGYSEELAEYIGNEKQAFKANTINYFGACVILGKLNRGAVSNGDFSFDVTVNDSMAGGSSANDYRIRLNYDNLNEMHNGGWFAFKPLFGSGDRGGKYVIEYNSSTDELRLRIIQTYPDQLESAPLQYYVLIETKNRFKFDLSMTNTTDQTPVKYHRPINDSIFMAEVEENLLPNDDDFPDYVPN